MIIKGDGRIDLNLGYRFRHRLISSHQSMRID